MNPILMYGVPGVLLAMALVVFTVSGRLVEQGKAEQARVLRLAAAFDVLLAVGIFAYFLTR